MSGEHRVHSPGRVNLIGDHTDYTGGLVFPMAIDRGTTLTYQPLDGRIELTSDAATGTVKCDLPVDDSVPVIGPPWGRYVIAMARQMKSTEGFQGSLASNIPAGAGLSSSAALLCAVGLALGFSGSADELARLGRRAEHDATGVPTGIMDQLCIASARQGHATMIDCRSHACTYVPMPSDIDVVVLFVTNRSLEGTGYAERVRECLDAESLIGPLRDAALTDVERLDDPLLRRRARHVVGENERVTAFAEAISHRDFFAAGDLMKLSHRSLRDDFQVSTPVMDAAVADVAGTPGVFGARMTGGGFGGCLVALAEPGALTNGWVVQASEGAHLR